jgi:hypothetical protein
MSNSLFTDLAAAGAAAIAVAVSLPAQAADPMAPVSTGNPNFILVSGGCGPNGWRGPGGACHWNHGPGWGPRGYYWGGRYWTGNGCPPGYWRGPWGHCRNTPYHGRLPNGGWKP